MFSFYKDFIVPFKEKTRSLEKTYLVNIFEFVETLMEDFIENLHVQIKIINNKQAQHLR